MGAARGSVEREKSGKNRYGLTRDGRGNEVVAIWGVLPCEAAVLERRPGKKHVVKDGRSGVNFSGVGNAGKGGG